MTSTRVTAGASSRIRGPCLAIAILAVAACQAPSAQLEPSGNLDVIAPFFAPAGGAGAAEWIVEGQPDIAPVDAGTSLRLRTGRERYLIARRLDTPLLASPFLGWSWNVDAAALGARHPIRLVVGFADGNQARPGWGKRLMRSLRTSLPEHDHLLEVGWGFSALERGRLLVPEAAQEKSPAAAYIVRGGNENASHWWQEAVDLSDLYRRAWPQDDPRWVRIVFAGFIVDAAPPTSARFASVALTR